MSFEIRYSINFHLFFGLFLASFSFLSLAFFSESIFIIRYYYFFVLITLVAYFAIFRAIILKRKERIKKGKVIKLGKGISYHWMEIGFIVLGVATCIIYLHYYRSIRDISHILLGLFWITLGLAKIKKGFITIENDSWSIKGHHFKANKMDSIKINNKKLEIHCHHWIYRFKLSSLNNEDMEVLKGEIA